MSSKPNYLVVFAGGIVALVGSLIFGFPFYNFHKARKSPWNIAAGICGAILLLLGESIALYQFAAF
jgi:uncharacterized membrane protein YdcZ (DUF606 family)